MIYNISMIKVLDFWAGWCPPCKIMAPIVEELENELKGKVVFEKINVDSNPQLAQKYNVMSIPTFIVLVDNVEVDRQIGALSKENFLSFLNKHLQS